MSLYFLFISLSIYALLEFYGWQALKTVSHARHRGRRLFLYISFSVLLVLFIFTYRSFLHRYIHQPITTIFATLFIANLIGKLVLALYLLPEDITRLFRFLFRQVAPPAKPRQGITRSQFISQAALLTAAVPVGTVLYGVLENAYNYQYRKLTLHFPTLPDAFDGFTIIQLSDIHAGSFFRSEPLKEAVQRINSQAADLIVFTGDLVNNVAGEMLPYVAIFKKLTARYGVISVTGNHDYGDYVQWDSPEAKYQNFERFKTIHKDLGWDLLLNENRILQKGEDQIAILGVENWGKGRFAKYGKFEQTYAGTESIPFKIMLSHDPSSWDRKIRPRFADINLTLSGHTHGAQFGIESKWLRWSPSQYLYNQWAGLYREGNQLIYVNRGFGFLGYPGRVGILPEVTEITLRKG